MHLAAQINLFICAAKSVEKASRKAVFLFMIWYNKKCDKMLQKNKKERNRLEFVSTEELVPKEHLLMKIYEAVDFNKIYEFVKDMYCADNVKTQA